MDSLQGLMNINMVNNVAETGAAEESSTWDKVKNLVDAGGAIIRFITWVCGAAAPTSLRTASRIASGIDYAEKAYDILQRNRNNAGNAVPYEDGGMSTREYLDIERSGNNMGMSTREYVGIESSSQYSSGGMSTREYMDSSSFDTGSLFRRDF